MGLGLSKQRRLELLRGSRNNTRFLNSLSLRPGRWLAWNPGLAVSVKTGFAGTDQNCVQMGVALGQITSPKHPAGILVIAVLAALRWPNQEKFFNAVC